MGKALVERPGDALFVGKRDHRESGESTRIIVTRSRFIAPTRSIIGNALCLGERPLDDRLRFRLNATQMRRVDEALGVQFVHVFRA